MNNDSKLVLSDDELMLVSNSQWILTKRSIMKKVDELLGYTSEKQKNIIANEKGWLPDEVVQSEPKISRGENYLQLPYLLLDYPRCFDKENVFAVRTMFWWANFFSITLQLSGKYKEAYQKKIIENTGLVNENIFICINENQWQHHFEADNYVEVKQLRGNALAHTIENKTFIKLAIKFPLGSWTYLPVLLEEGFTEIIKLLKD